MRDLFEAITLIALFVMVGLFVKLNNDFSKYQKEVENEKYDDKNRIEKMEKEIRILKTDLYIQQYGYEGGHND